MNNILFLSLLILSFSSQAAPDPACSMRGTRVLYTNGIHTSYLDAGKAMEKIEALGFQYDFNSKIDSKNAMYRRAYNYEESIAKDVLESAVQRLPQSYLDVLHATNAYAAYSQFLQGNLVQSIASTILNSITEKKIEILVNFSLNYANLPKYNQTIDEIKAKYEGAFLRGERIFAISHSQGSLFMNDVYNLLPESESKSKYFTGFQIASVLNSEMNTRFEYATNNKDRVVNAVRNIIGALPANLTTPLVISTDGWDDLFINHGILSTYLNDSVLRSQVISKLTATANLQKSNCFYANIEYTKNNLQVLFDSGDPQDRNPEGLNYKWTFGDGQDATTDLKLFGHTYSQAGTYPVSLKVTDYFGTEKSASTSIQVDSNILAPYFYVCNTGIYNSTANFTIDDTIKFSLDFHRPTDTSRASCECKAFRIERNIPHHLVVTATLNDPLENLTGPNSYMYSIRENIVPYDTTMYLESRAFGSILFSAWGVRIDGALYITSGEAYNNCSHDFTYYN